MMLQNHVFVQKKSPSVLIIVKYFIHLSLQMIPLTRHAVQHLPSEVYYHNSSGSNLKKKEMGMQIVTYRNFGTISTKTPLWYQNFTGVPKLRTS